MNLSKIDVVLVVLPLGELQGGYRAVLPAFFYGLHTNGAWQRLHCKRFHVVIPGKICIRLIIIRNICISNGCPFGLGTQGNLLPLWNGTAIWIGDDRCHLALGVLIDGGCTVLAAFLGSIGNDACRELGNHRLVGCIISLEGCSLIQRIENGGTLRCTGQFDWCITCNLSTFRIGLDVTNLVTCYNRMSQ